MRELLLLLLPVAALAQSYSLSVTINPGVAYSGYTMFARIAVDFNGAPDHVYLTSLEADKPGITVTPYCGWANPDCWTVKERRAVWNESPHTSFDVRVTPAANAEPGPSNVTITVTAQSVQKKVTIPVRVEAPILARSTRALSAVAAGRAAPPMPALRTWRNEMKDTGGLFCDPKASYDFGNESQVWYYDGAWVYFQMFAYSGEPKWKACALNLALQYRSYVLAANGKIPGWRVFTQGLRAAYDDTHDEGYKSAVEALANQSPFANSNGSPEDAAIRETAYLLRAYTDAHMLGIPIDESRARIAVDYLSGMADTLFAGPPQTTDAMIHQSFFDGIMAEALIYYYDNWTRDRRVPVIIQKLCNWVYAYLWLPKKHAMMYNPFEQNAGYPRHCESMCQEPERTLMNLVIPAYYWLWQLTHDDSYRAKGDEMFAHALDDPINDKGKSFSQNYHWSFSGVHWRTGGAAGTSTMTRNQREEAQRKKRSKTEKE